MHVRRPALEFQQLRYLTCGRTEQDQVRYLNGLRQVLAKLRASGESDFAVVTQAILDYRAQFLGDESRILPLGDVQL